MLQKKAPGFLMLEFICYLFLFSCTILLAFYFCASAQMRMLHFGTKVDAILRILNAADIMQYDMSCAARTTNGWKKISAQEIVFNSAKADIGWALENGNLIRREGLYDYVKATWRQSKKSLAASDVKKFSFNLQENKQLHSLEKIAIELHAAMPQGTTYTVQRTIYPRNGIIT